MKAVKPPVNRMLTIRQRLYAEARELGQSITEAARKAGCPEKTAAQAGSRLEKHPAVVAHRARLKDVRAEPTAAASENLTTDPKEYLESVISNPMASEKARVEAAKALLPFVHKKLGDQGKKEAQKERAGEVAGVGRFGQRPPPLRAVK